jgi:hypothetical protein
MLAMAVVLLPAPGIYLALPKGFHDPSKELTLMLKNVRVFYFSIDKQVILLNKLDKSLYIMI